MRTGAERISERVSERGGVFDGTGAERSGRRVGAERMREVRGAERPKINRSRSLL